MTSVGFHSLETLGKKLRPGTIVREMTNSMKATAIARGGQAGAISRRKSVRSGDMRPV